MIQDRCFGQEWIDAKRAELQVADPGLLEKSIHALHLLGLLADSGLEFIFKGGTSMLLLLPRLRRLSIDVDIATDTPRTDYVTLLQRLGSAAPFIRMEPDDRGERGLPRRQHFKFFYASRYARRDDCVVLDVLEEGHVFPRTERKPIRTAFIEPQRDVLVTVPPIAALLADKLTAFAPATVGIRLTADTSMQVVKQVADVGVLFEHATDLDLIRSTYTAVFSAENSYRDGRFTAAQALDDTLDTARMIGEIQLRGATDPQGLLLHGGMRRMGNHLIGRFTLDDLKVAAARAAGVAALLRNPASALNLTDLRYDPANVSQLAAANLVRWPRLNRLKGPNPEAFFLWQTTATIIGSVADR